MFLHPNNPRRAAKRYATLRANGGQKRGAHCYVTQGGNHGKGRILNREERRATGWRGPLPEQFAVMREKHRARKSNTAEQVMGKLDRLAARIGIKP